MTPSRRWSFEYTSRVEESPRSAEVFELPAELLPQHFELSAYPSPPLGTLSLKPEATLHEPFAQPDWQYLLFAHNNATQTATNSEQQEQVSPLSNDSVSSVVVDDYFTQAPTLLPRQPSKKPRYYADALSIEDKQALSQGQKNHNLKEWDARDLFWHHAARKELVPHGVNKLGKMNALAEIEKSKKESQRLVSQATDRVHESTYPGRLSQSMYDLRLVTTTAPSPAPTSPLPPIPTNQGRTQGTRAHIRAASSGPTLSDPPRLRRSQPPSGHTSNSSSRVRSPLANEVPQFVHNPEVTFDSFLAPHKAGKGETHWELDNVKLPKRQKTEEGVSLGSAGAAGLRRAGRMPSLPNLRKRFSRVGSTESE